MGITASPVDSDDKLSVTISGVPAFESITTPSGDTVTSQLVHGRAGGTFTFTISAPVGQSISGLTLNSSFPGKGQPVNTFTVTASNSTSGETVTSAAKTITVTDPPATTSAGELSAGPPGLTVDSASYPGHIDQLAGLMQQFMAAGFHRDQVGASSVAWTLGAQESHEALGFLAPHYQTA